MAKVTAVPDGQGGVYVVKADGERVTVPEEQLGAALAEGARPATQEEALQHQVATERGTFGQQALTGLETGLSAATLGISDVVGSEISPGWKLATRERRETNPNAALVGEIGGVVVPTLLSGGTSLAARGTSAVATPMTALGRVGLATESAVGAGARALGVTGESLAARALTRGAQMGAAGAIEGGVFEITRGMVDSVLTDTEYTAEKLTANIKRGVKWGAIGGGVVGVGGTLVGAAGKKAVDSILQGRSLEQAAKDVANNQVIKSVVGDLKSVAGSEGRMGQKILTADIPTSAPELAKRALMVQADSAAERLSAVAKRLDDARVPVPDDVLRDIRQLGIKEVDEAVERGAGVWESLANARRVGDETADNIDALLAKAQASPLEPAVRKSLVDIPPVRRASEETIAAVKAETDALLGRLGPAEQEAAVKLSRTLSKMEGVDEAPELLAALDGLRYADPTRNGTLFRGMPMTQDDIARFLQTKGMDATYHMPLSFNEDLSRIYPMRVPDGHEAVLLRVRDADEAYSLVSDRLSMDLEEMLAPKGSRIELLEHSIERAPKPKGSPIYRATESSEKKIHKWSAWSESEDTARAYLDNPGFGGDTLRTEYVELDKVLDITGANRRSFEDLAEALNYDDPLSVADNWWTSGYKYPWEESGDVARRLEESGYDWVRYTDDFPEGADVLVRVGDDVRPAAVPKDKHIFDVRLRSSTAAADEQARFAAASTARNELPKALEDAQDWTKLSGLANKAEQITNVAGKLMDAAMLVKAIAATGAAGIPGLALSAAAVAGRKFVAARGREWLGRMAASMAKEEVRVSGSMKRLFLNTKDATTKAHVGVLGEPDWIGTALEEATQSTVEQGGSAVPGAVRRGLSTGGSYSERYDKLKEQTSAFGDPKKAAGILEAATGDLANVHPEVAMQVHQQVIADAQYLAAQMPQTARTSLDPFAPPAQPSRYDKQRAVAVADALNDPPSVLEALASGRINIDQWRALAERRPKTFQDWRQRAILEMGQGGYDLPRQRRQIIGTAFQFPADWSMVPENAILAQQAMVAPEQGGQGVPGPTPAMRMSPETTENMSTPSQMAIGG